MDVFNAMAEIRMVASRALARLHKQQIRTRTQLRALAALARTVKTCPACHAENRSGRKSASSSSLSPLTISEASSRPTTGPSVMPLWETAS